MMKRPRPTKRTSTSRDGRQSIILPAALALLSIVLMMLPLEGAVSSAKALLSYVFIPQIRAAHAAVEYSSDVWLTTKELLETHRENAQLKEQLRALNLENEQAREIFKENERLTASLSLRAPAKWRGIWAKIAYREPSQWNSVVIDKGTLDGVFTRSAAVAQSQGQPVLAGVVVEADEHTAKVLLLRDEDFSAAVYVAPSGDEGLLTGGGAADLKMNYLPLLSTVQKGDKVYTSTASSVFPAGLFVGEVTQTDHKDDLHSSLTVRVAPAAEAASVRELFILTRPEEK